MNGPDWLGPEAAIDLSTPEARERARRIIRSVSWIIRMHHALRGTTSCRGGISPPRIPWDELVADLEADTKL